MIAGIFITVLLISAIRAWIENINIKSDPVDHLKDGTPIYIDRHNNQYANGEKIIAKYDYVEQKLVFVGQRSGKVYIDPEANKREKIREQSNFHLNLAKEYNELAYLEYHDKLKQRVTCEIATGRFIAQLEKTYDGIYRKYYLSDNPLFPFSVTEDDPGVVITEEEFDRLDISDGTHITLD